MKACGVAADHVPRTVEEGEVFKYLFASISSLALGSCLTPLLPSKLTVRLSIQIDGSSKTSDLHKGHANNHVSECLNV